MQYYETLRLNTCIHIIHMQLVYYIFTMLGNVMEYYEILLLNTSVHINRHAPSTRRLITLSLCDIYVQCTHGTQHSSFRLPAEVE